MPISTPISRTHEQSVAALANFALHSLGAQGYALYALNQTTGSLIATSSAGTTGLAPQNLTENRTISLSGDRTLISYPLRANDHVIGVLTFFFQRTHLTPALESALDRMAHAVEAVYCLPHAAVDSFARLARMETELMSAKISARTKGFLNHVPESNAIEDVGRLVEKTIQSSRLLRAFDSLLAACEEETRERRITTQAKEFLQTTYGLTEDSAYQRLRSFSRRSRRPIREVAEDILSGAWDSNHEAMPRSRQAFL